MSHMEDLNALMSRVKRSGDTGSIKFVTSLIAAVKNGDKEAAKGIIHFNKGEANLVPASVSKWIKESADMDIQEKVEIDGRTRAYRNTVMRLEQARRLRGGKGTEMQENKFAGLYDDGSGKGAIIPAPVDYNFHEAMKIVKKYRTLREKKKTLFGAPKGKMEDLEAAVAMKGGKFSMAETEMSPKQKEYRAFFAKALKKFGHKSPADMDDGEKKKFFNWIEKNWKG